ncbi:MAG: helix-turn-helix transcriptional regulator [Proteobacteria bacterium]|nr:helix-turn-helix transcriptional regulator [Pseudomonadota bacterium]
MGTPLPRNTADEAGEAAYLAQLGERVREWRAQHGVTRKALALASGVSERYLAQLETGQGNISVLLLRKLAQAMHVPIDALVREESARDPALERLMQFAATLPAERIAAALRLLQTRYGSARARRIALVGLRGAGKSTLGAKLAAAMDVPFVELDREIEREAGTSLGEVFSLYGQDGYRRFEQRALERVLHSHDRAVIAAGGSLVTDREAWQQLRERCRCIWLKASPEEHMARVVAQGDLRPFRGRAEALGEIGRLLEARTPQYALADATLDTSGRPARESFAALRLLAGTEQNKEEHR